MGNAKNYAVADFAAPDSVTLTIGDAAPFAVAQFSASWAVNEIPQAQCLLAVGRVADSFGAAEAAGANTAAATSFTQMTPARVTFLPRGEYSPDGTPWPPGRVVAFEGYFMGFAHRKVLGKFVLVAHLTHWLVDLACSSALTASAHVSNPTQLTTATVIASLDGSGAALGNYISRLAPAQLVGAGVAQDVWGAIKTIFCALASLPTLPFGPAGACGGNADPARPNDRALKALARIEGATTKNPNDCKFVPPAGESTYAVPLKMVFSGVPIVQKTVADALADEVIASYAGVSFWDKLVGQFCPMFGMAVVPMVSRALVIADTPAYRLREWQTIRHTEYDSLDGTGSLEWPLAAVGVSSQWVSRTQGGIAGRGLDLPILGGCWVEQAVAPGDGLFKVVEAPPWLRGVFSVANYRNQAGKPPGEAFGAVVNSLMRAWAHTVYAHSMLRGRTGALAGKLRFDIAPGSIVRIKGAAEVFLGAEDAFGADLIGCVARVTVAINAEAGMAATSFALSHLRSDKENRADRTSITAHPLFGDSIHGGGAHGAPLIPRYDVDKLPNDVFAP